MKKILILLTIALSLNAKIIEVEQLFNKTLVSVKEKNISLTKSFYGKTAINESAVVDINKTSHFLVYILTKLWRHKKNYILLKS